MTSNGDGSPDRWDEIDALLDQALQREPAERQAFLLDACGDDRELLDEVTSLVDASERGGEFRGPGPALAKAAFHEMEESRDPSSDLGPGDVVGHYALLAELGRGGMATVFEAERADGTFERRVAVKILRRGLDTADIVARFRAERQILASLTHPRIAQLIDGGSTDDGRPYLVMELVAGSPVDRYCDDRGLSVEARLGLFLEVAEAVEFAHRHLVIHRDLKPGNILVGDDGVPKLLDFGIAKLLEGDGSASGPTTRTGARYLTPEYAAPEQLLGERVSTQSDVYSLCVLLYRLLTGVRPYSDPDKRSALERVVLGQEPAAPSAVVPPEKSGVLRGDLDAILLRGLRSRPEDRYGSVGELAADLRRHLDGEPVTARGDARMYRVRKFTRRHRIPVAGAAGFLLLLAGSTVGLAVQRSALLEERNRAREAAVVASREAETARQVTAFLVDLFEGSDPNERLGDTVTARVLLERGTDRVTTELADQPATQAELLDAIGQVYTSLGSFERGREVLERAVAVRRQSPEAAAGLGSSLHLLGEHHRMAREWREAAEAYREAVAVHEASGNQEGLARALLGLGNVETFQERLDSAQVHIDRGIELLETRVATPDDELMSAAVSMLAGLERRRGNLARADTLYRRAVDLTTRRPTVDSMTLSLLLNNAAVVRKAMGGGDEAAGLYRQALEICVGTYETGHPTCLGFAANLASALAELGRLDESVAVYRARVDGARRRWPEGHWQVASSLMYLGGGLLRAGRPTEAVPPLREAVALASATIGLYHSWTNVYRGWLAAALLLSGQDAEGRRFLDDSLTGLGLYEGLSRDNNVKNMIEALAELMSGAGLEQEADLYQELTG